MAIVGGVNLILSPWFSVAASRHGHAGARRALQDVRRVRRRLRPRRRLRRRRDQAPGGCAAPPAIRAGGHPRNGDQPGRTHERDHGAERPVPAAGRSATRCSRRGRPASTSDTSRRTAPARRSAIRSRSRRWRRSLAACRRPSAVALGSAKSNIGHLEGAAGVAGLIKAVLTLRDGQLRTGRSLPPAESAHPPGEHAARDPGRRRQSRGQPPTPRGWRVSARSDGPERTRTSSSKRRRAIEPTDPRRRQLRIPDPVVGPVTPKLSTALARRLDSRLAR